MHVRPLRGRDAPSRDLLVPPAGCWRASGANASVPGMCDLADCYSLMRLYIVAEVLLRILCALLTPRFCDMRSGAA